MSELQKLAEMHDVALGAAVGGGVGAAGGLLTTLLRQKPTLKKGLINILVGGSGGAAVGAGAMALKGPTDKQEVRDEAPAATPAPKPTPRSMNSTTAALTGLAPATGPAIHGAQHGGAEQALRSGGRSALEGLGGSSLGLGLHLLLAKKGIKLPMWQAQAAGALAGSAHGAYAAAENFNEREKGAAAIPTMVDSVIQSPTGQALVRGAGNVYGKLPQAIRTGVTNVMLKNPTTSTRYVENSIGFRPDNQVKIDASTTAHNDVITEDRITATTPGVAGRSLHQLQRGLINGKLPQHTFPEGSAIQNRVDTSHDDITGDVLENSPVVQTKAGRAKAAAAQDVGRKIDTAAANIGGLNISPLSGMGGAGVGGTVGAALGGGAGLLGALFDGEDDGVLSTLRKALSGGALGGLAGAGVGANLLRHGVMERLPYSGAPGSKRNHIANETLKRFVTPVSSLFNRATGQIDKNQFANEVRDANSREAMMHSFAPLMLSSATRNNQR